MATLWNERIKHVSVKSLIEGVQKPNEREKFWVYFSMEYSKPVNCALFLSYGEGAVLIIKDNDTVLSYPEIEELTDVCQMMFGREPFLPEPKEGFEIFLWGFDITEPVSFEPLLTGLVDQAKELWRGKNGNH